ncbi:MAG: hypothetical protein LBK98_01870 [Peptococcaceae bacterium]|jgi:predicted  nucleic acid-binding Zn-ribbon protein|nr:hypothetical protein [Peptococcaceae bacterium]
MGVAATLLALGAISEEKNRIDPKKQLAPIYQEIKTLRGLILAGEKQVSDLRLRQEERQRELAAILEKAPALKENIIRAKEKMARQRGMSLKDMLEIQQEVARAEEKQLRDEARMADIRRANEAYPAEREQLLARIKELKENYNGLAGQYNQEKAQADLRVAALISREEGMLEELTPAVATMYREALGHCPENPVAILEKGICGGCRIGLSKQLIKHVCQDGQPARCENCLRLLLPADAANR